MKTITMLTVVHRPLDVRVFYKEALSLQRMGYQVSVIAPHDRKEVVEGINIIPIQVARNRFIRWIRGWSLFLRGIQQRTDVYHFHDPELIPIGLLLKLLTGRPVIYDVHEYYSQSILSKSWIPEPVRPLMSKVADYLEKRLSPYFDGVITVDTNMEHQFKKWNRNTVTLSNFPVDGCFFPPRKNDTAGKKQVIYVGNITRIRGLEIIIQTMDYVRRIRDDVVCLLIGKIDDTGVDPLLSQLFTQLQDDGVIQHLDNLNHNNIFTYLRQSHLGWNPILPTPSYRLAIPTKLYEYMAAGLPVISGDYGPAAQLIRSHRCGYLVDPLDPCQHGEAILRLTSQQEIAEGMAWRGYQFVFEHCNWQREEEKLFDFYECLFETQ